MGPTRWHWVVHAGVELYTRVSGCTRRRLARNEGVGPNTLALGLRRRCWSYTVAFGSKHRYWIIHAGVGPYIVAFSSWSMRSQGSEKRLETPNMGIDARNSLRGAGGCAGLQMPLFATWLFRPFLLS